MKNRYISTYILALLAVMTLVASSVYAADDTATIGNGGDDTTTGSPAVVAPAGGSENTIYNGGDDVGNAQPAIANPPASGSQGGVFNGFDDVPYNSSTPPTTPPVTPPSGSNPDNNVNNTSGGGSSGGSRRSGGASIVVTTTPVVTSPVAFTSIGTCPLITDYLKLGGNNNPTQVTKLQSFLKNVEKLNVDVSGVFDQKTEDAVKAFQLKYLPTVLGPWSATRATGNVYITTVKKINEIVCATPFVLSASDLAIIEAYNQGGTTADGQPIEIGVTDETGSSTDVGTTDGTEDNTDVAAAGGASILSRFWSFIKSLFR